MKKIKFAFTLAEILSVLIVLGVVAALTIPSTVKRVTERQSRTKVRKAMSVYDKALSQYYMTDYNGYLSEYNVAKVIDPNNELGNLPIQEQAARRRELINERKQRINDLNGRYGNRFMSYFNSSSQVPNSPNTFLTKDGILWYLGEDGKMLSVNIVVDKNFIRNLMKSAENGNDVTGDIISAANNSKDNRAFYMIAQIPNYAKTPISNPTFGKNLEQVTIFDLKDSTTNEMSNILKMQKLYNYLNMKTSNSIADKVCSDTNCCNNTQGTCINLKKSSRGNSEYWQDVIDTEANFYKNGALQKYVTYDSNKNETVVIDHENQKIQITKNGNKKCYTILSDKSCEYHTFSNIYNDDDYGNYGTWSDYYGCRTKQAQCD